MELFEQRLPDGFAWNIDPNGQLATVLSALQDEVVIPTMVRAGDTGRVRNPFLCDDYNALADEFGVALLESGGDEELFRKYLSTFVYTPYRTGSDSDMEKVLHDAGFTSAVVVKNNYGQDMRSLQGNEPVMVAGMATAVAGHSLAYAGYRGYDVLVNGYLENDEGSAIGYIIGNDPDYWGYVDTICGGVTYDQNGLIESVVPLEVSKEYESRFKELILRTKPLHNWIVMVVDYVEQGVIAQTGDPEIPTIAQTGDELIPIIAQTGV